MAHRSRSTWLASLIAGSLAAGCAGSVDSTPAAADSPSSGEAIGALDLTGYKSAGQVVCDLMNSLPGGNIGGVAIDKPTCGFTNYDNFYYLGSYSRPILVQPGTPPPSQRAQAMSDALFCALKDSATASNGNGSADGTVGTPVGRFGIQSSIAVPKYDAGARQVVGQRIGTLYLFGVGMNIEDQDYVATFPTERTGGGGIFSLPHTGYYMDLQSSTTTWHLGGHGSIGLFTLGLEFGQNGYFASMNNNAIALSPQDGNNRFDPELSWDHWQQGCNACKASGALFCDCPGSGDVAQHNAYANWTDAQFRNLSDGTLPYWGTSGGVSGNFVYRNSTKNWMQLGFANGGSGIQNDGNDADPTHNAANNPSTHLGFTFALDYDIIDLSLALNVNFRSGMELTQADHFTNEFKNHYADVGTRLDAESSIGLTGRLTIANPFPFGPDYLVDETLTILDPTHVKKEDDKLVTTISYDYTQGFPFSTYVTPAGDQSANAQAAHDACVAVPAVNNPPVAPGNPDTLLSQAASAAQQNMWPCHVKLCKAGGDGYRVGTLETCEWNKSTHKLDCVQTTQTCNVCSDSRADVCFADGSFVSPAQGGTQRGYCMPPR
jgi:hypothetical protein